MRTRELGVVIGLAGLLAVGCGGDGSSPMVADGGGSDGGGQTGGSTASNDASTTGDGNTDGGGDASPNTDGSTDGGASLFGEAPYERIAMPPRRLAVYDKGFCVILEDRTLYCDALGNDAPPKPPPGDANRDFAMVVYSRNVPDGSAIAMRRDGSVVMWNTGSGSMQEPQLPGSGYISTAYWGGTSLTDTLCGLRPDGSLECYGEEAEDIPTARTFVQINSLNGLSGLSPQGEFVTWDGNAWESQMPGMAWVAADHAHPHALCGLDTQGDLRCTFADQVFYEKPRDYSMAWSSNLCVVTEGGKISCRQPRPGAPINAWDAPGDDVFVDIDTSGTDYVCGVNTNAELKCFVPGSDEPGEIISLPMPAAVSD